MKSGREPTNMNKRTVMAIARKDMKAILSDSRVWSGMLVLPVLFSVVIPAVALILLRTLPIDSPDLTQMVDKMMKGMSGVLSDRVAALDTMNAKLTYLFLNYLLAPFFLLIPVINAMMIATNSFVGEKERRTLETLLFAPVDIPSLFLGKVLASFIPSYGAALGGFAVCGVLANLIAAPVLPGWIFPGWTWIWLMLWLVPHITVTVILISAFVSARVKTFQQAQSISGMVVLPVVLMAVGQATGLVLMTPLLIAVSGTVLLALNALLLRRISRMNERHTLFENQVH